jgi:hypothetical protein
VLSRLMNAPNCFTAVSLRRARKINVNAEHENDNHHVHAFSRTPLIMNDVYTSL